MSEEDELQRAIKGGAEKRLLDLCNSIEGIITAIPNRQVREALIIELSDIRDEIREVYDPDEDEDEPWIPSTEEILEMLNAHKDETLDAMTESGFSQTREDAEQVLKALTEEAERLGLYDSE